MWHFSGAATGRPFHKLNNCPVKLAVATPLFCGGPAEFINVQTKTSHLIFRWSFVEDTRFFRVNPQDPACCCFMFFCVRHAGQQETCRQRGSASRLVAGLELIADAPFEKTSQAHKKIHPGSVGRGMFGWSWIRMPDDGTLQGHHSCIGWAPRLAFTAEPTVF